VARAATTTDAFNAIAEENRRDILTALASGESAVGDLVDRLGLSQPQVSKHLGVLRTVGLVTCRRAGRHRLYRVDGGALRPVHEFVRTFATHSNQRLDRLDEVLDERRGTDAGGAR